MRCKAKPSYTHTFQYYDPTSFAKVTSDIDHNKNIIYKMFLLKLEGVVGM
jgi:hypothetical protein